MQNGLVLEQSGNDDHDHGRDHKRRHKHKKHKKEKDTRNDDLERPKKSRRDKEAGSESPESGEILPASGETSPALQSKPAAQNIDTDGPVGDREGSGRHHGATEPGSR